MSLNTSNLLNRFIKSIFFWKKKERKKLHSILNTRINNFSNFIFLQKATRWIHNRLFTIFLIKGFEEEKKKEAYTWSSFNFLADLNHTLNSFKILHSFFFRKKTVKEKKKEKEKEKERNWTCLGYHFLQPEG